MKYSAIFNGYKNGNFGLKIVIFFLVLLKTLIVGTSAEAVLTSTLISTHDLCFRA